VSQPAPVGPRLCASSTNNVTLQQPLSGGGTVGARPAAIGLNHGGFLIRNECQRRGGNHGCARPLRSVRRYQAAYCGDPAEAPALTPTEAAARRDLSHSLARSGWLSKCIDPTEPEAPDARTSPNKQSVPRPLRECLADELAPVQPSAGAEQALLLSSPEEPVHGSKSGTASLPPVQRP
jgi:hypothetical protein